MSSIKELPPPADLSPQNIEQIRHLTLSSEDGRDAFVGTELRPWLSEYGLNRTRLFVEIQYLCTLSQAGVIRHFTDEELKTLDDMVINFSLEEEDRVKEIETRTHHDVTSIIRFIDERLSSTSLSDISEFIHYGLTSDDINNLAWRINLREARDRVLQPAMKKLLMKLVEIAEENKEVPMLGRSHGQPAVPTTFGKEFVNFAVELSKEAEKLSVYKFSGKLNGAIGTFEALSLLNPDVDWLDFSERFIASLGLEPILHSTQVNPNLDVVEYLQIMSRINTTIHKLDTDTWRYISDDWLIQKAEGDPSSTMPNKVNPIDFEHSEGECEKANGMIDALARELPDTRLQRDLSDTPLFRDLPLIYFRTLDAWQRTVKGLNKITADPNKMLEAVNANWAILASPTQLLLRKAGIPLSNAYDGVKRKTQGKKFDRVTWKKLVESLITEYGIDNTDEATQLRGLSPATYIGKAKELTEIGIQIVNQYL